MRIWTVFQSITSTSTIEHASWEAAREFAQKLWLAEKDGFQLSIYRRRHFRRDTSPTDELLEVYNKDDDDFVRLSPTAVQSRPEDRSQKAASA
jgi:hypothetical protein